MDKLERGTRVLATTIDGVVERLVWDDCGDAVELVSPRQFEALSKGWKAPMPIGFLKANLKLVDA
jgi:hypothetical protein